jgi:two-component system, chemotaxis family, protein-glutamate methylesterase/glutaminase
MPGNPKIRILIVDDSAIVRKILTEALSGENDMEVVGTAPDPYIARDKIISLRPDVLTLDIEMPRMDGLTFLKKLMHFHPIPTIVISSLAQTSCHAAIQALEFGAAEVLAKPGGPYSVGELRRDLAGKVRAAAAARLRRPNPSASPATQPSPAPATRLEAISAATAGPLRQSIPASVLPNKGGVPASAHPPAKPRPVRITAPTFSPAVIFAIGASTGGTEAIAAVLTRLPQNSPGIVITQHIPAQFSNAFAKRLNELCAMEVKEAQDGDTVQSGRVLVAPGDFHMILRKGAGGYYVSVKTGPRICYQRPSVDVLFASVAETAGADATGILLTGMGTDGAQGMLKMHRSGARTIAQDEASCVVYGMPREAVALGAADQILPLSAIAEAMLAPRLRRSLQEDRARLTRPTEVDSNSLAKVK